MLIPIQTARTAASSAEDTGTKTQQPLTPLTASQRGEAIQKILDALTRHLSGREILSKDALVRLMEDLARILKFPPLPQEGGREFVARLVAFLESMPASDRLLLERQLGGRSLAMRVGLLADLPAIRHGASTPGGTATSMPAQARDVILRNPSLQPAMPFNPTAPRAPVAGEVALLQAVLRKTFGVGNDSEAIEPRGDDGERTEATAPQNRSDKPTARSEARPSTGNPASADRAPVDGTALLLTGEAEVEHVAPAAAHASQAEETVPFADSGNGAAELQAQDESAALPDGQTFDDLEANDQAGDPDPDGTYGPLPDADEEDGRRMPTGRADPETRATRVFSEAIKTLIRDSVPLPGSAAAGDTRPPAERTGPADAPPSAPAQESAAGGTDVAARERKTLEGGTTLPLLLDEQAEDAKTGQRVLANIQPQSPAEEPTMQQMIARLVENGLPREAIPFTMIPYPPVADDAEHFKDIAHEQPGSSDEDTSGEEQQAEAEADNGEGDDADQPGETEPGDTDVLEAPDAYDLYRRLGGLG